MIHVKSFVLVILVLQSHVFITICLSTDIIQVCSEHVGVFTWPNNIMVAYYVILLSRTCCLWAKLCGTITVYVLLVAVMGFGMY